METIDDAIVANAKCTISTIRGDSQTLLYELTE